MRYFIDTEFIESGPSQPLALISVGVVAEDFRQLYRLNQECDFDRANDWVRDNVIVHLPMRSRGDLWRTPQGIARDLIDFVGTDKPEFWGWCCDYDYVLISQLIGFDQWPAKWPYYFRDIQQVIDEHGSDISKLQRIGNHDALQDAREIHRIWSCLQETSVPT